MKMDILHYSPDNSETTRLGCEGINLVSALPDIAEEAFDGIGALDVSMHRRGKGVKSQQMLLILHETAYRFGIAVPILGLDCCWVSDCLRTGKVGYYRSAQKFLY